MAQYTDYTEKTEPVDTDLALIYDIPAKVNKKFTFGNLWKWIAKKIVSEGISQLETTNKTIPGAINELNSKTLSVLRQVDNNVEDWNNIASPGIYSGNGSTSKNTPIKATIWINAFVVPSNGNVKYLTAYAITDKGIFFRSMDNGRWEAWLQIK